MAMTQGYPPPAGGCDPAHVTCRCPYDHPWVVLGLGVALGVLLRGRDVPERLQALLDWAYGPPCWMGLPELAPPFYWRLPPLAPLSRAERRGWRRVRRAEQRSMWASARWADPDPDPDPDSTR